MNKMIVVFVVSQIVSCGLALGEEDELESAWNAVVTKYRAPDDLRQRVDTYKSEHAAEFAAAKADFELAVRSIVSLDIPLSPDHKRRQVIKKRELPSLKSRDSLLRSINSFRSNGSPDALQCADFWESHFEDVVIGQTPAHLYVYFDCLLNGWYDWSQWTTPKLIEVREKHPDVYLMYAVRESFYAKLAQETYNLLRDVLPQLLILLEDHTIGPKGCAELESLLEYICSAEKDMDVMKYCVLKYIAGGGEPYLSVAGIAGTQLNHEQRREFWEPFLVAQNEQVRLRAVSGVGDTIRKPRPGEDPRPEDAALAEQLRQILQNDPSLRVRDQARYKLRLYDKSDTRPTHGRLGVPNSP